MKQVSSCLLAAICSVCCFSQNEKPFVPCCNIINIKADPFEPCCNIITARSNTTGRIYAFKPTIAEANTMKIGDAIAIDKQAKNIIEVNGATKSFVVVESDPFVPCCGITSIKADPFAPCCNIVSAKVNGSNETFSFSAPKTVSSSFKVGQSVARADNYAFLSTPDKTTYSYSTSDRSTIGSSTGGAGGGKVHLELPADAQCFIFIYNHGTNKEIIGTSKDRMFFMAPGVYDIKVSSVKMEEITVQKGVDTKILAGILNITSPASWQLFDESKKIRITGSSKPEKIGLPVGNYELKISGSFLLVTIKDGETVTM